MRVFERNRIIVRIVLIDRTFPRVKPGLGNVILIHVLEKFL